MTLIATLLAACTGFLGAIAVNTAPEGALTKPTRIVFAGIGTLGLLLALVEILVPWLNPYR